MKTLILLLVLVIAGCNTEPSGIKERPKEKMEDCEKVASNFHFKIYRCDIPDGPTIYCAHDFTAYASTTSCVIDRGEQ